MEQPGVHRRSESALKRLDLSKAGASANGELVVRAHPSDVLTHRHVDTRGCVERNSRSNGESSTKSRKLNIFNATRCFPRLGYCARASRHGEPGSITRPGHSGFSHVGIVTDDAAGLAGSRVGSPVSPCLFIPALFHTHLASPLVGSQDLDIPEKPADQCHRLTRFPYARIWGRSRRKSKQIHLGGSRVLGCSLVYDRPIMNAVKYRVVPGVVWTNRTMVSSNTDTNRTGVLAVVDVDKFGRRLCILSDDIQDGKKTIPDGEMSHLIEEVRSQFQSQLAAQVNVVHCAIIKGLITNNLQIEISTGGGTPSDTASSMTSKMYRPWSLIASLLLWRKAKPLLTALQNPSRHFETRHKRVNCDRVQGRAKREHSEEVTNITTNDYRNTLNIVRLVLQGRAAKCGHSKVKLYSGRAPIRRESALSLTLDVTESPLCCPNSEERARERECTTTHTRGHDCVVVTLLASHVSELGSIPADGVAPRYSYVEIVPDDAAGRRFFSEISKFPRPCSIFTLLYPQRLSKPRCREPPKHLLTHSPSMIGSDGLTTLMDSLF
ncbi:hypothetical protein PR048_030755 [Dryococelus australis]|uniref:Uncharacterized protein n=1 Tax=Dryococelus australis TaxID=614101 RepID=A0ABQ9G9T0_9NEOP|nr:hypothetical protein PR048_030755 [Dryococelus australis]